MITIGNKTVRKVLSMLIPFLFIPSLVVGGAFIFREKSYSYVSLAVTLLSLLLFVCGFEKKQTGTRRLIIIAVMTALAVVGRFIFSPIPGANPVSAIAITAAIYLGKESGFLIGALSALISNFYAGQGVWTPFQMLTWGLIGLVAGLLSVYLKKSRIALCAYGLVSGLCYSLLMDIWSVIWYNGTFSLRLYAAAIMTAIPHTVIYAVSTAVFLLLFAKPFGEKLERVKIKYGV